MKKYFFLYLLISFITVSCSKSIDHTYDTRTLQPFSVSVKSDTTIKYFIQNTDIPISLDSMTIHFNGLYDGQKNYHYLSNHTIIAGTKLEDFVKSNFQIDVPKTTVPASNIINVYTLVSDRFATKVFSPVPENNLVSTTNGNFNVSNISNGVFILKGIEFNQLYSVNDRDKVLILRKSNLGGAKYDFKIFALKKNEFITSPPVIKDFKGELIPFSESPNYYYIYFYPNQNSPNINPLQPWFRNLVFYKNVDLLSQVGYLNSEYFYSIGNRINILDLTLVNGSYKNTVLNYTNLY
jgi:hypothetical protein